MVNAIPGRNLPVSNFANHLPWATDDRMFFFFKLVRTVINGFLHDLETCLVKFGAVLKTLYLFRKFEDIRCHGKQGTDCMNVFITSL